MTTAAELSAIAWALSMSDTSTFTETLQAHEDAAMAHSAAGDAASMFSDAERHYSLARTHRIEAQTMRRVIAAGRHI